MFSHSMAVQLRMCTMVGWNIRKVIGLIKGCLKKTIGQARISYDELVTIVAEVEITLNSHPLKFVCADDLDEPLTPSHLLVGYKLNNLPDPLCGDDRDPTYGESHSSFDLSKRLKHLSVMLKHFWNRWQREYLT